jgi:hypothetical protein
MKTYKFLIYLLFFGMFSCTSGNKSDVENIETDTLPAQQFITEPNEKKILWMSDTLFKGDTLKIKFRTPHPKDLGLTTPDGKFFFVIYSGDDISKPSLMDWNEFANRDYLEIITNKTKANPWDANIAENQIIFTKTGKYKIQLSENLETDDGTPVEMETVYYIDEPRKL